MAVLSKHGTLALTGLVLAAVLAGCSEDPPGASKTDEAPAAAAAVATTPPPPPPAARPLSPELTEIFRLIEQRRTGPARVRLVKHLKLHPDDAQAEFLFGLSYHREKRYGLARPRFERAVERASDYHPARHFLGWCLYYLGDLDGARQAFMTHLAAAPEYGDTHFALGLIDLEEDRLDDAAQRFRRALALASPDADGRHDRSKARTRLADVHLRRGELEQARAELLRAVALLPENGDAYYKLYRVHLRLGDLDAAEDAQRHYQRILEESRHPTRSAGRAPS